MRIRRLIVRLHHAAHAEHYGMICYSLGEVLHLELIVYTCAGLLVIFGIGAVLYEQFGAG